MWSSRFGEVERPAPLAPARDQITVTNYRSASRAGIIDFAVPLTFSYLFHQGFYNFCSSVVA